MNLTSDKYPSPQNIIKYTNPLKLRYYDNPALN